MSKPKKLITRESCVQQAPPGARIARIGPVTPRNCHLKFCKFAMQNVWNFARQQLQTAWFRRLAVRVTGRARGASPCSRAGNVLNRVRITTECVGRITQFSSRLSAFNSWKQAVSGARPASVGGARFRPPPSRSLQFRNSVLPPENSLKNCTPAPKRRGSSLLTFWMFATRHSAASSCCFASHLQTNSNGKIQNLSISLLNHFKLQFEIMISATLGGGGDGRNRSWRRPGFWRFPAERSANTSAQYPPETPPATRKHYVFEFCQLPTSFRLQIKWYLKPKWESRWYDLCAEVAVSLHRPESNLVVFRCRENGLPRLIKTLQFVAHIWPTKKPSFSRPFAQLFDSRKPARLSDGRAGAELREWHFRRRSAAHAFFRAASIW